MPAIFFQEPLPLDEFASLKREFPHYELLTKCEDSSFWATVEVLYGSQITEEQLHIAPRLRWVHCPTADTESLCLNEIRKRKNVLITLSKGQNVPQIAEFVIGTIFAFGKQFFHWKNVSHDPDEFRNWPLKDTMWSMQKKTLLQVGLGEVGSAVVKLAGTLGMKTWGIRRQQSFHPYCRKTFSLTHLHSLLPAVDVVVVALPQTVNDEILFGFDEFNLMKPDSIFIVVGAGRPIDEEALAQIGLTGKFRGIWLDAFHHPPSKQSPLWEIPNTILTPSVASLPASEEHMAFRLFRKNLRFFVSGKINEMKNRVI